MLGKVEAGGSALASWAPLYTMLGLFALVLVVLYAFGRSDGTSSRLGRLLLRIPDDIERVTGIPGWAGTAIGLSLYGLLVAGQGFYSDVAWHVALGRDKELFTAPHTSIVIGLGLILLAALAGTLVASLQQVDTTLRWRNVRIPWSMLPLGALGVAAVSGFPLDELWHAAYGIDVTMWSPTHMLMILGASFTGVAAWLVLGDAGVRPTDSRWARGVHVVAAWLTLQGLSAPLGEFAFGVPQFQQMFHPLLATIAAAFGLVAIRLVHGRGWALGIVAGNFVLMNLGLLDFGGSGGDGTGPVDTREVAIFLASAVVVEVAALLVGTARRLPFAVAAGVGVGTLGLAGEWWWNRDAYQPWTSALLPDAVLLSTVAAVGSAIVATAFASALAPRSASWAPGRGRSATDARNGHVDDTATAFASALAPRNASRAPGRGRSATDARNGRVNVIAGLVVLVCIALPLPRHVGEVHADLAVGPVQDGYATVEVTLDPPDAADEARWFQASSWQGGGLVLADMREVEPGRFVSAEPVPVDGTWKTLVRLHRGSQLMTIPVYLPADPEIGEPEIPAESRSQPFESETDYLLRETHPGDRWFAYVIYGLLLAAMAAWIATFWLASARIASHRTEGAPVHVPVG